MSTNEPPATSRETPHKTPHRTIAALSRLDGRVAVVVGGAGHIGRAALATLVELGARVAVFDVDVDAGRAALAAVGATAGLAYAVDVKDAAAVKGAVDAVVADAGRLDVVVHSAAYVGTTQAAGWAVPFAEQSADAFAAALQVNLTSAFVLAQHAAPHLAKHGVGSVVLVSSIYGSVAPDQRLYEGTPMANPLGYGASKAGLEQLARSLATALAPSTRVNCVSPGGVWRNQNPQFIERYVARTPLGRMATEEDLKGAFAYLCSDLSRYVTGHNLLVDGGWTAW